MERKERTRQPRAAWAWRAAAAAVFVATMLYATTSGGVLDVRAVSRLHTLFGESWYPAARLLSEAGGPELRATVVVLAAALLAWRKQRVPAGVLAAGVGAVGALGEILKKTTGRPRPTVFPHGVDASGLAFPSGHSAGTAVKSASILAGAMFVALVGWSRLVLGVHYPTDVAGGIALGVAVSAAVIALAPTLGRRFV